MPFGYPSNHAWSHSVITVLSNVKMGKKKFEISCLEVMEAHMYAVPYSTTRQSHKMSSIITEVLTRKA